MKTMKCFACGTEPTGEPWTCECGGTRLPPVNDNVDLLVGILEGCIQGCDMQIPYYAYGDNQAACEMADRLNQIRNDLHNAIEIINSND